jgi:predicted O-methyltransferase YrrM
MDLPPRVEAALARARAADFTLSCEPTVGRLLALLAGAVPPGGRILELGTGVGVGLGWIVTGLGDRSDVRVISVDLDPRIGELAGEGDWPSFVRLELGDGAERVGELGRFDLIFADAPGGKLTGIEQTIDALRPRGLLLLDDMDLAGHDDPELKRALARVRATALDHPELLCVELEASSGILLARRRG